MTHLEQVKEFVYFSAIKNELIVVDEYDHHLLKRDSWEHLIYLGVL